MNSTLTSTGRTALSIATLGWAVSVAALDRSVALLKQHGSTADEEPRPANRTSSDPIDDAAELIGARCGPLARGVYDAGSRMGREGYARLGRLFARIEEAAR